MVNDRSKQTTKERNSNLDRKRWRQPSIVASVDVVGRIVGGAASGRSEVKLIVR